MNHRDLSSHALIVLTRLLFAGIAVFLLQLHAAAQTPAVAGELQQLQFLVGEWKGEGWRLRPDGSKENRFSQKTKVQVKDNSLLRVKDERTYKPVINSGKDTIFSPGSHVFHTSTLDASIYYDNELKLYRWRGENQYGRKNPLEVRLVRDKTLQYGIPFDPQFEPYDGNRRITIQITDVGEWHETLEIWHSGKWYTVEESTLKKIK